MPTNNIAYPLSPTLSGSQLTVDLALNQPLILTNRIAQLTADQLLIDKFCTINGQPITGGGMIYTEQAAVDSYLTREVEQRGPGDEYTLVWADRPPSKIAKPEDWGGKFFTTDEARIRNNIAEFSDDVMRLANTIVRKLNARVLAEVDAAVAGANTFVGHNWNTVVTVGPPDDLTPNASRPASDFAQAQLAADLQELGYKYNLLVVHPIQAKALKDIYAENLNDVLSSAGLDLFASPRVTSGTAYAVQKGGAGYVSYEKPLTTDVWREEARKITWTQSYAVPAIAITAPTAIKKITGLAG